MGTEFVTNKRIICMKAEVTPGTAVSLASADFDVRLRGTEVQWEIPPDQEDAKFATGDHAEDPSVPGIKTGSITTEFKVCPTATIATVNPKYFKVLQACGCSVVDYTTVGMSCVGLAAADAVTATVGVYDVARGATPVAKSVVLAGCMGDFTIGASDVGQPITGKVTFKGKFSGHADVANGSIPALTSPDSTSAQAFIGGTCTIGAVSGLKCQSFEFSAGNGVEMVKDVADATGVVYATVAKRNPRLKLTVLQDVLATFNPKTLIETPTTQTITIVCGQFSLVIPVAQLTACQTVDVAGTVGYELSYRALRNGTTVAALAAEATYEILHGARA
jgi:hypothetical protein